MRNAVSVVGAKPTTTNRKQGLRFNVSRKKASSAQLASSAKSALFDQLRPIAQGIGETLAPFCEVVVHDLTDPKNAIVAIHNNLSGRKVGQPATELGLARIADPSYPQTIANYANTFADGRQAKSTPPKYVVRELLARRV